jgi:nicotinamidase-related amidase
MKYEFILVDLQNDFASEEGVFFTPKPSVEFLQNTLFPYFEEHSIKVNEIISDYRQPRQGIGVIAAIRERGVTNLYYLTTLENQLG